MTFPLWKKETLPSAVTVALIDVEARYVAVEEAGLSARETVVFVVKVEELVTEKLEKVARSFPASS